MRHNVTGYVKNLCDGKVELVLEGPLDEVQCVVEAVKERMCDYIRRVDEMDMPATGEYTYFSIRHC
jgi:acylphosphatase